MKSHGGLYCTHNRCVSVSLGFDPPRPSSRFRLRRSVQFRRRTSRSTRPPYGRSVPFMDKESTRNRARGRAGPDATGPGDGQTGRLSPTGSCAVPRANRPRNGSSAWKARRTTKRWRTLRRQPTEKKLALFLLKSFPRGLRPRPPRRPPNQQAKPPRWGKRLPRRKPPPRGTLRRGPPA